MARQGLLLLALCGALAAASHTPKIYTHRARLVFEVPEGVHVETTQTTVPTTQAGDGPTQVSMNNNNNNNNNNKNNKKQELQSKTTTRQRAKGTEDEQR